MASLEEVLLEEARRQLGLQAVALDDLRSRAITVLAASGVIAGLFIDHILPRSLPWGAWAALGAFGLGALVALAVIVPRDYFALGEQLQGSFDWYDEYGNNPQAARVLTLGLAKNLDADRRDNRLILRKLNRVFTAECLLLGLQLAFWIVALID